MNNTSKNNRSANNKTRLLNLVFAALCAALIAICSWITIPVGPVPFTLQTFAVFLTLTLIGGKYGLFSVVLYIAVGLLGAPVFAGFKGGAAVLFGATGGYIIGFIFMALIYWGAEKLFRSISQVTGISVVRDVITHIIGLAVCYLFGTLWFMKVYSGGNAASFYEALSMCVIPFIIPDLVKLGVAMAIAEPVGRYVRKRMALGAKKRA